MTTITAQVTDTNNRARGAMAIQVDFDDVGPFLVEHGDQTFYFTGKSGTNTKTGLPVRELSNSSDARLWITLDGTQVFED